MKDIKYILFDAANTLIHKPDLWINIINVLQHHGYKIGANEIQIKHKILSEIIDFPDVTSKEFYQDFNAKLLNSLGIVENETILNDVFGACKYLPWVPFADVKTLSKVQNIPFGVLSNFNGSLRNLLQDLLPDILFEHVIISEEEKVAKPSLEFYQTALEKIGLKAHEILYIGDSLKLDVIPALKLGFNVRLIDRQQHFKSSEYRMDSLSELSLKLD